MVTSDAVFKALADPTRREILGLLRSGARTVGTIAGNFRMSRPAVSKHVRVLRAAGLIRTEAADGARLCALDARPLQLADAWLRDYQTFWNASLRDLKSYVEETP
jgi:DNA-binding transcriptional ArsR family regulator